MVTHVTRGYHGLPWLHTLLLGVTMVTHVTRGYHGYNLHTLLRVTHITRGYHGNTRY